jgi:DNA-binding LacI/PurR family transcriptional regulator
MNPPSKVTRAEVALAAKVSTYTVSQVMAGRPGPSQKTREHVLRVAEKMGYRPNVAASILSSQHRPDKKKRLKIGVLRKDASTTNKNFYDLAAQQLGLDIELIDLSRFSSPEAAGRELYLAGFDGLVLSSLDMPWTPEERARFPWDKFCLVKRDRAMPDIPCDLIRESAFDFVNLTLENITALRYRRLAVILTENVSPRDDDARHGAVYNFRKRKLPPGTEIFLHDSPTQYPDPIVPTTLLWIKKIHPDVVIFFHRWLAERYIQQVPLAERCPSIAAFNVEPDPESNPHQIAGCIIGTYQRIEIALHILIDNIRHNKKGFSKIFTESVIPATWFPGQTLQAHNQNSDE